jgi:hypothetical protein
MNPQSSISDSTEQNPKQFSPCSSTETPHTGHRRQAATLKSEELIRWRCIRWIPSRFETSTGGNLERDPPESITSPFAPE